MSQHVNNRIGNVVGEAKSRTYQRLKSNLDLRSALALFIHEVQREFAEIVADEETKSAQMQIDSLAS